ncbi:lipoate--protein ligase family protein [Lyngbya confervoides]|uniref:Lipoate--protein ligase family protein n=1 Tax=Lyngbya confervoides BDU141951 TaxID=1574623 RepID=A0ABD4T1E3_9CYAN|nr:biotin/lipoate A/B protein ligase family protein [Lyngbya confervoides]MCM1982464.1 lipoate--protein ligase family protein [Lyngbya confervoides BDU141951]
MAIDHWLLDRCNQGVHPPTLRFYTWPPATVSLGYFQKQWPQAWRDIRWRNQPLTLVRRPTGGRAVLHHRDLTYAVVTHPESRRRRQVYETICEFLVLGWKRLGLEIHYGQARRGYHHQTNCFAMATGADLVVRDGTKFIGSAQAWRQATVLQHGSMALHLDPHLTRQVFPSTAPLHVPWLRTAMGDPLPSIEEIVPSLQQAAAECFAAQFEILPLQPPEWSSLKPYIQQAIPTNCFVS